MTRFVKRYHSNAMVLRATLAVLAASLLQYARTADVVPAPWRNCTVLSPEEYLRRLEQDPRAPSCETETPLDSLNRGLAFCECTYDGEGSYTKVTKGIQ